MYKKDIKVMDCTVRDGGLMNKWQFSDEFVRAVYKSCVEAGIDYMEIGYKSSEHAFSRDEVGPWKFCDDKDLRRVVGENNTSLKLSAMADIGRIDPEDIPPKSESLMNLNWTRLLLIWQNREYPLFMWLTALVVCIAKVSNIW